MVAALAQARLAAAAGEVPVGAVVVQGGLVIGAGHNRTVADHAPVRHAEVIALAEALEQSGDDRLPEATLYVTLEPCAMCAGAIVLAKVGRVVFGAWDPKAGMAGSVYDLLREPRLNHRAEVIGGALEAPCAALLTTFFEARR